MNILSRDKQIDIIAALSEGISIRSIERLTGVHRDTIMRLGARVGHGCAELHDRMMVGLRVPRIECDELWQYVGCKQKRVTPANAAVRGDQYTFVALVPLHSDYDSLGVLGYAWPILARALSVVNIHLMRARSALRCRCQAAISRRSHLASSILRSRHWPRRMPISISTMLSQLACLGV